MEFIDDFLKKLLELYHEKKYLPEDIYNADEVNIQVSGQTFEFLSTSATVRKNLVGDGHLTALICANAAGSVLTPFFIFPGEDIACLPGGSLENAYMAYNKSAYMDKELFQQWLSLMVSDIRESRTDEEGNVRPALLLFDGHSSHLNSTTLMTAACQKLDILCLPSHTTHLLQPNDCALNKTLKDNMQENLASLLEVHEKITLGELAHLFSNAIACDNVKRSVIQSFRHTGVFPHDPLQMSKMLVKEKVKALESENEKIVEEVATMVKDHVGALESIVKGKRKREEATPKVRKCRFSTKKACILTASTSLTALEYSKEMIHLESMKVDEL